MDLGSMLYNSLKDVTWSTTTLPLDRLVSAYRLPQIVQLDSGKLSFSKNNNIFFKKPNTNVCLSVHLLSGGIYLLMYVFMFISLLEYKLRPPQQWGAWVTMLLGWNSNN